MMDVSSASAPVPIIEIKFPELQQFQDTAGRAASGPHQLLRGPKFDDDAARRIEYSQRGAIIMKHLGIRGRGDDEYSYKVGNEEDSNQVDPGSSLWTCTGSGYKRQEV